MKRRTQTLLSLALPLILLISCLQGYAVRTRAHTLMRMPAFSLFSTDGRKHTYGKPWSKVTILVFIRGYW